jgi:hypothetical protein
LAAVAACLPIGNSTGAALMSAQVEAGGQDDNGRRQMLLDEIQLLLTIAAVALFGVVIGALLG